jgi:hypothetical protein
MTSILMRRQTVVNTDPLRRCYDGHHYKSEMRWTAWSVLEEGWTEEQAERRLEYWRGLGRIALEERGEKIEYKIDRR